MGGMGEMTANTKPEPVLAWELLECSGAHPRVGAPSHALYERRDMASSEAADLNRARVLTTQRWHKVDPRDTSISGDNLEGSKLALAAEVESLHGTIAKLRNGECLGTIPPTDVACQRDCYCSVACQTRDADGSRGDLSRTLVPEALVEERDRLYAALGEACDIADAAARAFDSAGSSLMRSGGWYEQRSLHRERISRIGELRVLAARLAFQDLSKKP